MIDFLEELGIAKKHIDSEDDRVESPIAHPPKL